MDGLFDFLATFKYLFNTDLMFEIKTLKYFSVDFVIFWIMKFFKGLTIYII